MFLSRKWLALICNGSEGRMGPTMLVHTLLEDKPDRIITTTETTTIDQVMDLLIDNKIGCLPVVSSDGTLVGIVSDKDIFKTIHKTRGDYHSLQVSELMTTKLVVGVPDDDVSYAAGLMSKNWIRHLPIMDGEKIVGMISMRDILKSQMQNAEIENRYLNMYMDSLHRRDKSGDV